MEFEIIFLLLLVGMIAGFVDTLAGGGGMITLPALNLIGIPTNVAIATNKLQGCFGLISAIIYFLRKGNIQLRQIKLGIATCVLGSACGVMLMHIISNRLLELIVPAVLIVIAILLISIPTLGEHVSEARLNKMNFLVGVLFPIAVYDGFLGPGTGTFIMLGLVYLRGLTLQQATIEAKFYNATTNITALAIFIFFSSDKIHWIAGLSMAAGQLLGARIAARMILLHGNQLIRPIAILMSVVMSLVLIKRYWF